MNRFLGMFAVSATVCFVLSIVSSCAKVIHALDNSSDSGYNANSTP